MKGEIELKNIIKEYIEYSKTPSSIEEIKDIKSLYQAESFKKLYDFYINNPSYTKEILTDLSLNLSSMDILKSSATANFCGVLIEKLEYVGEAGKKIIELFKDSIIRSCMYITDVSDFLNKEEDTLTKEDIESVNIKEMSNNNIDNMKSYYGLNLLSLSVMASITRDFYSRKHLRNMGIYDHIKYMENYIYNVEYVGLVYNACSAFEILVLVPYLEKGFFIKVNDLNNCFHLFTLLELELYKNNEIYKMKNYEFNNSVYEIATGKKYAEYNMEISSHLEYYTAYAIQEDGSYKIIKETSKGQEIDANSLIWGEMPPESIPHLNGFPVIIIDNNLIFKERKWAESFISKCHNSLNPSLEITQYITKDEYMKWIEAAKDLD